ncbi:MAG: hypothetical protein AB7G28_20665 [Pirellulales bacterium]
MPVNLEIASTFEFTRDWMVSSPLLVETLLAAGPEYPSEEDRIQAAKDRIEREEIWVEPDPENAGEDAPDVPSPVHTIPRALVRTVSSHRRKVGTQTFAGSGELLITIWALAPEEYRIDHARHSAQEKSDRFSARRKWAIKLAEQIRDELLKTSGRSDGDNPYLNAQSVDINDMPMDFDDIEPTDGVDIELSVGWQ